MIIDSHTHTHRPDAVINIDPVSTPASDIVIDDNLLYSVGIHPWNVGCYTQRDAERLHKLAANPRVIAIGETGLDTIHETYEWVPKGKVMEIVQAHPSLYRQIELLMIHIELSEKLGKPLLLHIVKRYPEIMRLRLKLKPTQPWIIHGFRGKPGLARDLLKFGFYLSYGAKFNELSVKETPPHRMLAETDDSDTPFAEILAALPVTPAVSLTDLYKPGEKI